MTKTNLNSACCEIKANKPDAVFYIHSGGYHLGDALAECLEIPLFPLDIRYPLSRFMERYKALRPICWLFKELIYRCTRPREVAAVDVSDQQYRRPALRDRSATKGSVVMRRPKAVSNGEEQIAQPKPCQKVVLADDRISSGRTLDVALQMLEAAGIPQENITVVTWRCNHKNRHRVHYVIHRNGNRSSSAA